MSRGYVCVGLQAPKTAANVGSVVRACGNFGVSALFISEFKYKHAPTDSMKTSRHLPIIQLDQVEAVDLFDCRLVAVELVDYARPLPDYIHPERAMYLFGSEDGSLDDEALERADDIVFVPTSRCMNLAATVHVVLYDRMMKQWKE